MAEEFCVLCLNPVKCKETTVERGRTRSGDNRSNDGSLLEKEMNVVFIVRKLLSIPSSACEELLGAFGNPSDWLKTCSQCSGDVRRARKIQQRINKLEKDLERERDEVKRKIVASYKKDKGRSERGKKLKKLSTSNRAMVAIRNLFISEQVSTTIAPEKDEELVFKEEADDSKEGLQSDADALEHDVGLEDIQENDDFEMSNAEVISAHDEDSEYEDATTKKRNLQRVKKRKRKLASSSKDGAFFDCLHCPSSFTTQSKLKTHQRRNHKNSQNPTSELFKNYEEGRTCSDCNQEFDTADEFRQHCIENHAMLACIKCPQLFSSYSALSEHKTSCMHFIKKGEQTKKASMTVPLKSFTVGKIQAYQCRHCNFCHIKKGRVYNHMRGVHWSLYVPSESSTGEELAPDSGTFQCDKCPSSEERRFPSLSELNNHKVSAHGMVKCDKCSSIYIGVGYLENHQEMHHSAETADPAVWLNKRSMAQSTSERKNKEKKLTQCKFCQEMFKTRSELTQHNLQVHPDEMFKCDKCPRLFDSARPLYSHKTKDHNEPDNPYKCYKCDYSNRDYLQVHRHVQTLHEKRSRVVCELCSDSFSNEKYLKCHKIQKHGDQPNGLNIYCEQCNKTFSTPTYLKRHIKTVHLGEWRYKCPICEVGFMGQKQVDHHVNKVHKNYKPLTCPKEGCEWKYTGQWELKRHLKTLHAEGPLLKCSKCDYETYDPSILRAHERNHNTGSFQCDLCGKSYTIYKCFQQHLRMTHKIRKKAMRQPAILSPFVASMTMDRENAHEKIQNDHDDSTRQNASDTDDAPLKDNAA